MVWIQMEQDKISWLTFVSIVMNLPCLHKAQKLMTGLVTTSQSMFCFVVLIS